MIIADSLSIYGGYGPIVGMVLLSVVAFVVWVFNKLRHGSAHEDNDDELMAAIREATDSSGERNLDAGLDLEDPEVARMLREGLARSQDDGDDDFMPEDKPKWPRFHDLSDEGASQN